MKKMYGLKGLLGATALVLASNGSVSAATLPTVSYNGGKETATQESRNGRTVLFPESEGEQTLENRVGRKNVFSRGGDSCWIVDVDLGFLEVRYESPGCRK